ncbi:MAG: hypothetical protein Q8922_08970 [Bacteroidota bacterium]|nr:hypothetical protein [Bacteroidota bacterium]MDP4234305.1 hypothetical protein [Bacteroidota bacterium]MDP4243239.1 hypothetical protein [Bacteroidota bacterium]MDP4288054.1 hypothetical protein [Bacteroidota bacterium]
MNKSLARVAVISSFCLSWAGCSSSDITSPTDIIFPASGVSYHAQVAPYLTLACNTSHCHDGSAIDKGAKDMTSWVGVRDVVGQPGDTLTSPIVSVMYARENHAGAFLANDNQRNGIKVWVLEGAKNN